jgi:hypothetical protein
MQERVRSIFFELELEHPDTNIMLKEQGNTLYTWRYNPKEKYSISNKKVRKLEMPGK